jgi:hypothetical protein
MKTSGTWSTISLAVFFLLSDAANAAENKIRPGEFIVDHP